MGDIYGGGSADSWINPIGSLPPSGWVTIKFLVYVCEMQSSTISKILVLPPNKEHAVWISAVPLKNSDMTLNTLKPFSEPDQIVLAQWEMAWH